MTADQMRSALETMGVMTVAPFNGGGYAGVQACCPVCTPGRVIWTEQTRKWVCNKPTCASRKNPSLIVDKFDEQHPRIGGFANGNGNGHRNGRVVVPDPRETHHHPPRRPTGTRAGFTPRTR